MARNPLDDPSHSPLRPVDYFWMVLCLLGALLLASSISGCGPEPEPTSRILTIEPSYDLSPIDAFQYDAASDSRTTGVITQQ